MVKKSRYFKLIDAIDIPQTITASRRRNGITRQVHIKLMPGEKYELEDDEVFVASLKRAKVEKKYTTELEQKLKDSNIPYKEKVCRPCGGRVKHLIYCVVEVVE